MTNIKTGNRNLKKFILIAAIGSIAFATPSFAQDQTPTVKQDKAQRKVAKKQVKMDKKESKMDKKESKMNKKQRKVDALQSPVNKKIEPPK
jgi:hypothetical protein